MIHAPGHFNWCAYGSDYPPNVLANTNGSYTLAGTPPFTLIASNGTTMQTVNGTTIATADVTMTPATITDATGYPGLWCPYTGSDLYMDATHRCRQRQSGAQNWEAWIKDTRDNELYRIVLMPDYKWWLAQNVKYDAKGGVLFQNCGKDSCGRCYSLQNVFNGNYATNQQTVCPPGWVLPSATQWSTMATNINVTLTVAFCDMRSLQIKCLPITDRYGWAAKGVSKMIEEPNDNDTWFATTGTKATFAGIDQGSGEKPTCNSVQFFLSGNVTNSQRMPVRCLRP